MLKLNMCWAVRLHRKSIRRWFCFCVIFAQVSEFKTLIWSTRILNFRASYSIITNISEIRTNVFRIPNFLLLVWVPTPVLRYVLEPKRRGFFCDDETIRYDYKEPQVPDSMLFILGLGVPILGVSFMSNILVIPFRNSFRKRDLFEKMQFLFFFYLFAVAEL